MLTSDWPLLSAPWWLRRIRVALAARSGAAAPQRPMGAQGKKMRIMSPQQTAQFLLEDRDKYAASLSRADLSARRASSAEAYKAAAARAAMNALPSRRDLERVVRGAEDADAFFASRLKRDYDGIDGADLAALPWVIAFTKGSAYEDGLPHTRGDIIFLSLDHLPQSSDALAATLVHEKVHVYQRAHGEVMRKWLQLRGYEATRERTASAALPHYRSNPDTNGWSYRQCHAGRAGSPRACGKEMGAPYSSERPARITDVVVGSDGPSEHPYEKMAYDVESLYRSAAQ